MMLRLLPRPPCLVVATGFALLSGLMTGLGAGCAGGTTSQMDGAIGGATGAAGSSGGGVSGNGGGENGGGSGGGSGNAGGGTSGSGSGGPGGQLDAGSDTPPATDAASDTRLDLPVVKPTITLLTPSSLPTNNGAFTLLVDGRDFPPGRIEISFETNVWTATVVSETRLSVQIPGAALGGMPRQAAVQVSQPTPPYVESNILYFSITAPQ